VTAAIGTGTPAAGDGGYFSMHELQSRMKNA
jgi:hypothetical protein